MSKTLTEIVAKLQEELTGLEERALLLKQDINRLCRYDGQDEPFPNIANVVVGAPAVAKKLKIRNDHFTGMKLGKAARLYLEMRNKMDPENRAVTLEEIRDGLLEGGYVFGVKDTVAALGISLGKSSQTFQRVGNNGRFGLTAWYGGASRSNKPKTPTNSDNDSDSEEDDDSGSEESEIEGQTAGNEQSSPEEPTGN